MSSLRRNAVPVLAGLAALAIVPAVTALSPARAQQAPAAKAPERPALLAAGAAAPDFAVPAYGTDKPLKLSDYKGKVVVLDFWATWCGPCMRSMPHLEEVAKGVKGQDVVVIALCTSDTKEAYEKWVAANKEKYSSFTFAFDPAGRDPAKRAEKISSTMYNVSGIPTTYVIGKDGKVVDAVVGYRDGDTRVEAALAKAGIKVPEKPAAAAE